MDLARTQTPTLDHCRALDAADPLRELRAQFALPPGLIYLDGNSLGPLPHAARQAVGAAVEAEWGQGLIRSWNDAGWITRAQQTGDAIAALVGAGPGELLVADNTSVNLYKVLSAALTLAEQAHPSRRVLLSERDNFPTDRYIAQGLCAQRGWTLQEATPQELAAWAAGTAALPPQAGVLMLTQVHYRSGALHDMAALNRTCRAAGVLTVWDLAHSAGALPIDLKAPGAEADFAVGCGYKYLNGGPGAPAFVWAHPRHVDGAEQPLRGWLGHAAPFAFEQDYRPAPGIARYVCGTPAILSLTALQAGVATVRAAEPLGGMAALRAKSLSLTRTFIAAAEPLVAPWDVHLLTPRDDAQRGSQVSWAMGPKAPDGYAVMRTLIAGGVIGDFRAGQPGLGPDILRFGFAPLYNTHEEAWQAAQALGRALAEVAQAAEVAAGGAGGAAHRPAVT